MLRKDEDYIRAKQILNKWDVAEAFSYILNKELEQLNEQWINADEDSFLTLQGRAKQLKELLLLVAPTGWDKQQEGDVNG